MSFDSLFPCQHYKSIVFIIVNKLLLLKVSGYAVSSSPVLLLNLHDIVLFHFTDEEIETQNLSKLPQITTLSN